MPGITTGVNGGSGTNRTERQQTSTLDIDRYQEYIDTKLEESVENFQADLEFIENLITRRPRRISEDDMDRLKQLKIFIQSVIQGLEDARDDLEDLDDD